MEFVKNYDQSTNSAAFITRFLPRSAVRELHDGIER
jgi:hypothetical protein